MLSTKRFALLGLAVVTALLFGSAQPVAAQYRLQPFYLPYAPPDLTVKVTAPPALGYWVGGLFTITVDNPLTLVNGSYAGSTASGVNATIHLTGLTVVSVDADSGFVCLPVYPFGSFRQLSPVYCTQGTIPAGGRATITVIAGYVGVDQAADAACWPAYTDAQVSLLSGTERDLTNNRAIAATDGCPQ